MGIINPNRLFKDDQVGGLGGKAMVKEKEIQALKNIFESYDFVMTTTELYQENISKNRIKKLVSEGIIEKIKRGYYHWNNGFTGGDMTILKKLFPDVVFCMETAAFYYGYSDRTPIQWSFAIHRDVSKTRLEIKYPFIKPYRMESSLLNLGVRTYAVDGFDVKMFDKERTICDFLRHVNHVDKETFNKVIQAYVNDPQKNIPNLIKYAEILRVQKKVDIWIGVWL